MRSVLALLLTACTLIACDGGTKQVVATTQVTLDLAIAPDLLARIDELRAALLVDTASGLVERSRVTIAKAQLGAFVDLPILPSDPADEQLAFEVLVEARSAGTTLVQQRVAARFTPGAHTHVPVALDLPPAESSNPMAVQPDSARDAAAPDASVAPACPADHGCPSAYPCVPTARGYTCRGRFADWPMPDSLPGAKVAPRYTSGSDSVIDEVTQLEWQVGIPLSYPECTAKVTSSGLDLTLCTRDQARRYCEQLTWGGKGDWRLPSRIEFVSLLQTHHAAIAIDDDHFGEFNYYVFVSDSPAATGAAQSWQFNFYAGAVYTGGAPQRVRCVRGGAEPPFATPAERYAIDEAAGTVTDRATTLVWRRSASPMPVEPAAAAPYCQGLGGGFRPATTNELLSLVDPTRTSPPLIDPAAFPGTPFDVHYLTGALRNSLGVSFDTGELMSGFGAGYVRCVR